MSNLKEVAQVLRELELIDTGGLDRGEIRPKLDRVLSIVLPVLRVLSKHSDPEVSEEEIEQIVFTNRTQISNEDFDSVESFKEAVCRRHPLDAVARTPTNPRPEMKTTHRRIYVKAYRVTLDNTLVKGHYRYVPRKWSDARRTAEDKRAIKVWEGKALDIPAGGFR